MLSMGSTSTSTMATRARPSVSRFRIASPWREQSRRPALQEDDDGEQDRHLGEHGAERGLDALVEPADARRGEDRPRELADAARHYDHERIDDVVLAERGPDVSDLRQRAAPEARETCAESEGDRIDD